jgi:hypothetical protein
MSPKLSGRIVGALFLSAFVLYGLGAAIADRPAGVALVLLNSVAVAAIGVLLAGRLRSDAARTARGYLAARIAESVLLAAGVCFTAAGRPEVDALLYAVAMAVLAVGSIPMCLALGRLRWVPTWFALWGAAGYALLGLGAALEFAVAGAGVALAVPGGLFELAFGTILLLKGFPRTAAPPTAEDRAAEVV